VPPRSPQSYTPRLAPLAEAPLPPAVWNEHVGFFPGFQNVAFSPVAVSNPQPDGPVARVRRLPPPLPPQIPPAGRGQGVPSPRCSPRFFPSSQAEPTLRPKKPPPEPRQPHRAEVPAILPAIAAKVNLPKMGAGAFAYSKLQTRHATLLNSQELTLETDASDEERWLAHMRFDQMVYASAKSSAKSGALTHREEHRPFPSPRRTRTDGVELQPKAKTARGQVSATGHAEQTSVAFTKSRISVKRFTHERSVCAPAAPVDKEAIRPMLPPERRPWIGRTSI